ncbi:MAG: heparinase II/III family protein [Lentisphaerae bacterium]|nr:heparinase II/III family protein [Lentisphaerota bacterium]
MKSSFGCAKPLFDGKIHPRLFCGPQDLLRLRKQIRTGYGLKLMNALRKKVRPLLDVIETADSLPLLIAHHTVRKHPRGGSVLAALADIAFVGVLDDNARAVEAAQRVLLAVPEALAIGPRNTYDLSYGVIGELQLTYDFLRARLSPEACALYTRWAVKTAIRETLRTIRAGHFLRSAGANIPMVGMMSALMTLLAVKGDPGVPDLAEEEGELVRMFEAALFCGIGSNGYPAEDIAYGSGMVSFMARLVEPLRRAGLYDAYALPRYRRFGRAMLHFVQPWGKFLSNTGDYGADFGWRSPVFPRLATETRDPTLLWLHGTLSYPIACAGPMDMKTRRVDFPELKLAPGFQAPVDLYSLLTLSDLRKPVHPSKTRIPTQFMDSDRGIVTFRSSWKPDATFVVFDGAQRPSSAQGHAHDSGGHFSLSALGEYFAIDTGRYNIEQDQHNVVLVDGKSGQSTKGQWRASWYQAVLTSYRPGPWVDTASVNNSQMADCYWSKRTLGLVKETAGAGAPAYVWTVEDINKANDYREFWWTMNVHPDHRITCFSDHATIIGSDHGNFLDVHFALPDPAAYPKPHCLKLAQDHQQYGSYAYPMGQGNDPQALAREYRRTVGHLEYGPVFYRPRLIAKVAGYNGRFMAVMLPRRANEPRAKVESMPTLDNGLALRLTFDKVVDTVLWAYDHHLLEADGIKARAQWCVVRRQRKTGRVLYFALGDGYTLAINGKRYV